jgi:hypothetical protein
VKLQKWGTYNEISVHELNVDSTGG